MKINFRNIFQSLFPKQNGDKDFSRLRMLNSYSPYSLNYNEDLYNQAIIRACIHAIASQFSKLTPKVFYKNKIPENRLFKLESLLTYQPNEHMNICDFLYKCVSMLFTSNNVFVYVQYKDGQISGLYPVNYQQSTFYEYENQLYVKFLFKNNGFQVILPYEELIHIRRHYNQNDLFGSEQREAINPVLQVMHATNEGMINAVKATGQLRGIMKYVGNLKNEDLAKIKQDFVDSYMSLSGDGIGSIDSKCEFIPTEIKPITINEKQQKLIIDNVCMLYGVSEAILKGNYKEDEYNAFYNSTIEPLAMQFSKEFTNKLFTMTERNKGNKVILSADKMTFANNATKSAICRDMLQLGVLSINECRSVFESPEIEDGDRHIVSLNYVNLNKADSYQGVEEGQKDKKEDDEKTETN